MDKETCEICGFPSDGSTVCDECAAYYEMTDPNSYGGDDE